MKLRTLLWLCLPIAIASVAAPSGAAAQELSDVQRAKAIHEEGVRLFQGGEYRQAAAAFERAEQLAPDPVNLYNRARCSQQLGEYETALLWLDRYLATPDLPAEDVSGAERLRGEILEAQQRASPAAAQPAETPGPSASPEPGAPDHSEEPGRPEEPAQAPSASPRRTSLAGPWAVLGVGLGLLLGGGALDVAAFVRSEPPDEGFTSIDGYNTWRENEAHELAIAGDVLVSVGAATAVAGLVWLLIARSRRPAGHAGRRLLALETAPASVAIDAGLEL